MVYRLTFHPLAKYPGAVVSRISSLSIPFQAASGDRHLRQLQEHRQYGRSSADTAHSGSQLDAGPVVRIGPSSLSFASPAALRTIYQSGRAHNPLRKSDYYKTVDAPAGAYSTHTETNLKKHAFRRRILDFAFSDASMRSAEKFIIQNIDTFCGVLGPGGDNKGSWSEARDMSKYCTYFTYDVMGDLIFGKRFDCMTSPENRYVPKLITDSSWLLYWVSHLPLQFIVRRMICSHAIMSKIGGEIAKAEHAFVAYASSCVKDRVAKERETGKNDRRDMMHYILDAKDPETGQPFTDQDLDAESSLLIAAGADTTSSVLAAAFFYLTLPSTHDVLIHLQRQLRHEFRDIAQITWSAIQTNQYLRAVIEETLRMAPVVPSELPRTILREPGLEIAGHFIPAGTTVGCSAYVLHHDETAYPDSFSFRPERWIPHETVTDSEAATCTKTHLSGISPLQDPQQVKRAREAFCAFSLGSRGCVGKTMAYMELCLAMARILWTFDIRRAGEELQIPVRSEKYAQEHRLDWREDEYQLKDVFITDRAGPVIHFKRHFRNGLSTDSR